MKYPLKLSDIQFVAYRRSRGPGGQHNQKTSTAIRATHEPTGIMVNVCNERSQSANKEAAVKILQARLDQMLEDRLLVASRAAYEAKPEAAWSSQIRTYRLTGNAQGVVDHRTGFSHPNARAVLRGDLDGFLRAGMVA